MISIIIIIVVVITRAHHHAVAEQRRRGFGGGRGHGAGRRPQWATSILYYTILSYTILYHTILCYTILYHTILYYSGHGAGRRPQSATSTAIVQSQRSGRNKKPKRIDRTEPNRTVEFCNRPEPNEEPNRNEPSPDASEKRRANIQGFDHEFTNYSFIQTVEFQEPPLNFTLSQGFVLKHQGFI